MRAKYLEIPINTVVSSGTSELVVGTTASAPLSTGTNANAGIVSAATNAAGGTGYPTPGVSAATSVATGSGDGNLTVTYTQAGGVVDINTVVVVVGGADYEVGDTFTIDGGSADVVGTITVLTLGNQINEVGATFVADGVVSGDIVYNVTAGTQTTVLTTPTIETQLDLAALTFPLGGEVYAVRKDKQLNAVGSTFTTRKVRVGDTVKNTTAVTNTTVATLINETSLTLTVDIFNSSTLYNDNFTIEPPATEVYDNGKTFLSTVSVGDIYENTTQNFSEAVTQVIDNFRLGLSSTMGTIGDAYSIFDTSVASTYLVQMDQIVLADRVGAEQTNILLNTNATPTLTIDHSDQGAGRAVAIAIQDAMKRGYIGVNMPEPPGPSTARVQMPIFENAIITVESVSIA